MLLWLQSPNPLTLLELQSWSQGLGLVIKRLRVVGVLRGRGVTQARLSQVVQLKRDSHLWCGWVQYGCLDVCEGTSVAGTRVVNSV